MTARTTRNGRGTVATTAPSPSSAVIGLLAAGAAVAAVIAGSAPSFGSDLRMTVEPPHFTCEGHLRGYSDVAWRPADETAPPLAAAAPLPCCDGQIGCAQFLSTNTVVRTPERWHG